MAFPFISISDTHFGLNTHGVEDPTTGLNTRALDGYRAFDQTIDFAIENNIKLIVHSGDVFNTKNIGQNNINAFYERVARLNKAGIFFYCLHGNHDSPANLARKNGLDIAATLDVDHTHFTHGNDYIYLEKLNIQIVSLSYWNTAESIEEFLENMAKNKVDWEIPVLLVAHLEINYPGSIGAYLDSLSAMPLELLTKHPWTAVQLGHIHKPQVLHESPKVFYTGSLVRCTFTEELDPKGFWLNTIKNGKFSMKQIPIDCLDMATYKGTMEEIKLQIDKLKPADFKNKLVRVIANEDGGVIDEKYLKDKFIEAFKYSLKKESKKTEHKKIDTTNLYGLNEYAKQYFKDNARKKELLELVEHYKSIDEAKNTI